MDNIRELKFRAWDGDEGVILPMNKLYGYGMQIFNSKHTNLVFMQYTGLKDKNGKEIYEGDIIKYTYPIGYSLCEVKFGDYDNGEHYEDRISGIGWYVETFATFGRYPNKEKKIYDMKDYPLDIYPIEVIGNIYENTESLEVKYG
jgi:uncharacterized phage protein (TIGR01671 family)